jgi:D-amino peptidase
MASIFFNAKRRLLSMKVYISFDMEGTTGTAYWAQMGADPSAPDAYRRAQRFATDDAKAAIDGILKVDPEAEIWFNDAHRNSMNVLFEEFPENVSTVVGSGEVMDEVLGIDASFDALICVGAHGNVLTQDAVLCHVWQAREVTFNSKSLSETGLNASLAGYYGVPLVAMSGDEASMRAIKNNLSDQISAAVVKKGIGRYSALCVNPEKAKRMIKEAVIDGLNRRDQIPPVIYQNPVTVEIEHLNQFRAHAIIIYMRKDERLSPTRTRFIADNALEAYFGFFARNRISLERHNIR